MSVSALADGALALLGREGELARIAAALDDAVAGRGRLFLLIGEPGIGKTSLCDERRPRRRAGCPCCGGALGGGRRAGVLAVARAVVALADAWVPSELGDALGDGRAARRRAGPRDSAAACRRGGRRAAAGRRGALPPVARRRRARAPRGRGHAGWCSSSTISTRPIARRCCCSTPSRASCAPLRVLLVATCRDVEARLDPETSELVSRVGARGDDADARRGSIAPARAI